MIYRFDDLMKMNIKATKELLKKESNPIKCIVKCSVCKQAEDIVSFNKSEVCVGRNRKYITSHACDSCRALVSIKNEIVSAEADARTASIVKKCEERIKEAEKQPIWAIVRELEFIGKKLAIIAEHFEKDEDEDED
jgi:hypothetical protein